MIKKVIDITGVGKFTDYHAGSQTFGGELHKINAIYADNGSGKTTLAQILKSLGSVPPICVTSRKSFTNGSPEQKIIISCEDGMRKFRNGHWDSHFEGRDLDVEVFDAEYADANVYVLNIGNANRPGTFFELVIGDEAIALFEERKSLFAERKKARNYRIHLKRKIREEKDNLGNQAVILNNINLIEESRKYAKNLTARINEIDNELDRLSLEFGSRYIDEININLRAFAPGLEITQLNKKATRFVYHLKINGVQVRNDSESISLKRTLSEGDKNAIAFSFFMSRLKIKGNLENTIIVFDDPITSLDYKRRNVTKTKLANIAQRCKQFFLLSHDIQFVKDFKDYLQKYNQYVLNLKIQFDGKTAYLSQHDIHKDTLRGIFKDMTVIHDYVNNADRSSFLPRDVIRCIRPVLEGFLKIKYFGIIDNNKWLGDILGMIREATEDNPLHKQKANYEELCELNDYTSEYHHGDSPYTENDIVLEELRQYCKRTIDLIYRM